MNVMSFAFLLNNSEGYIFFPWVIDSDDVMVCLIAKNEVIILDVTQHTPVAPSSIEVRKRDIEKEVLNQNWIGI